MTIICGTSPSCYSNTGQELSSGEASARLHQLLSTPLDESGKRRVAICSQLLTEQWASKFVPIVRATVEDDMHRGLFQSEPWAIEVFAHRYGNHATIFIPDIESLLRASDKRASIQLLRSARAIGRDAGSLETAIRAKLNHSEPIVAINAASALIRVAEKPDDGCRRLLGFLLSKRPELRWRAADATAYTGTSDVKLQARLKELLRDEDVRVRVTAAFALWRLTKNAELTLPILTESLKTPDVALATGFVYPSFQGDSHRLYAIQSIANMDTRGKSALPTLISVVREVAKLGKESPDNITIVGIAALNAIKQLEPISEPEWITLRDSVICEDCPFVEVAEQSRRILDSIRHNVE